MGNGRFVSAPLLPSPANVELLLGRQGGDGKTSASLAGGSFLPPSAFQMPWTHGKEEEAVKPRPAIILDVGGACVLHVPVSADGVVG